MLILKGKNEILFLLQHENLGRNRSGELQSQRNIKELFFGFGNAIAAKRKNHQHKECY